MPIFHLDAEHGFPTFDAGIASDDLADLKLKLSTAFDHGDLVVTTGGVSMGDKDLLRQILVQVRFFSGFAPWSGPRPDGLEPVCCKVEIV